jgi:hypothetical protein
MARSVHFPLAESDGLWIDVPERSGTMSELIVATGEELICLRAQNGQWHASKLSSGGGMQCLTADSRNPNILYAGSHGEGMPSIPMIPTAGTFRRIRVPGWLTTVSKARRRTSTAGAGTARGSCSAADCPSRWTASLTLWRWARTLCSPAWETGGYTGAKIAASIGSCWTSPATRRHVYWH